MRFLKFLFLFLYITIGHAEPVTVANQLSNTTPTFDTTTANKQFDRLNLKLSTQGLDPTNLKSAVKTLKDLMSKADECTKINEKKLSNIDNQIKESSPSTDKININTTTSNKSDADLVYLSKERKNISSQLAQCRLFTIRAKEAIEVYETTLNKLKKEEILSRSDPLWTMLSDIKNNKNLTIDKSISTLTLPEDLLSPITLGSIFSISLLITGLIFYLAHNSKKMRLYVHLRKLYLTSLPLLTLTFTATLLTFSLVTTSYQQHNINEVLIYLAATISGYLFLIFLVNLLFNIKKIKAVFCWYSLDSDFFKNLIIFLFTLYTIFLSAKLLTNEVNLNEIIWKFSRSILLYAELIMATFFVYYFCKTHRQISFIKKHKKLIQSICTLVFISCAIIDVLGYHSLAIHLTLSGTLTFAIIFGTILLEQAVGKLYELCVIEGPFRSKLISFFGYKKDQTLKEILILKITIQISILIFSADLIIKCWGYSNTYIETLLTQFMQNIQFETFTFHPTKIISGIIVFCVLYLLFRGISTAIGRNEQFDGEEETQVAVSSILTYIGFTVAVIAALLVAGFDFTGLAIIAGALSVGIGLGLQSIVNNFVSGIILLIEKPIKPGDRIEIDGVEGYVKKIRVRSTQILTTSREDMIIPNSDLITHRVTNYMYSDKYLTIYCEMGIKYGSDILLARDLLIKVASEHSEVITSIKGNAPRVYIRSFGENSMLFQVWFLIKDGNKKVGVRSELYFEIERVFKENNINIAYPQRDIHIKLSEMESITPLK